MKKRTKLDFAALYSCPISRKRAYQPQETLIELVALCVASLKAILSSSRLFYCGDSHVNNVTILGLVPAEAVH